MPWLNRSSWWTKALQAHQSESGELLQAQPMVVMVAKRFEFHAAQAPNPPSSLRKVHRLVDQRVAK
jgi:hypothetical protein